MTMWLYMHSFESGQVVNWNVTYTSKKNSSQNYHACAVGCCDSTPQLRESAALTEFYDGFDCSQKKTVMWLLRKRDLLLVNYSVHIHV